MTTLHLLETRNSSDVVCVVTGTWTTKLSLMSIWAYIKEETRYLPLLALFSAPWLLVRVFILRSLVLAWSRYGFFWWSSYFGGCESPSELWFGPNKRILIFLKAFVCVLEDESLVRFTSVWMMTDFPWTKENSRTKGRKKALCVRRRKTTATYSPGYRFEPQVLKSDSHKGFLA